MLLSTHLSHEEEKSYSRLKLSKVREGAILHQAGKVFVVYVPGKEEGVEMQTICKPAHT